MHKNAGKASKEHIQQMIMKWKRQVIKNVKVFGLSTLGVILLVSSLYFSHFVFTSNT